MVEHDIDESEQKLDAEVAPALIAVHPYQKFVSVAVGSDLRVFSFQHGSAAQLSDDTGGHKDSIRAIRYSKSGNLFVSGGDDKLVKVWDTDSWRCVYSVVSEKRVTSLAVSGDDKFVSFADKFGVVYVVDIGDYDDENRATVHKKAVPILSHYCSIITRLDFSPDGRYIISADRDFKIRVTLFSKERLEGAHEIQCFCLGHTEFVCSLAFPRSQDYARGLLVSGSGDSTVRLWDYNSGSLLDTCEIGTKAGLSNSNQKQEDALPAVTDLCETCDGSMVAAAIQRTLSIAKVVSIAGETFIPTSISAASSVPLLWMVMGASSLSATDSTLLARVRVVSGLGADHSEPIVPETSVVEDKEVPGGEPLLQALQGRLTINEEASLTTAEAVKTAMHNLLIKKQYSAERRDFRKRGRNDKKIKP
ncbi:hypothetical protein SASPL_106602 [Salvia splendens]|uniref:tRNA (guanine-N(7)-)-methyltransferase non-catalytic subunit n=1 Tax=Salvia splendens TaxID=180675 RepID=A0A8X9A9R5_SALSN|nr:hypothetical protein SASPL_106602 [Salvia splendens]